MLNTNKNSCILEEADILLYKLKLIFNSN